jgi:hypothetical protein
MPSMKEFVVYHNPDRMNCRAINESGFRAFTNNPVANTQGCRVWLVTGEGAPRKFSLRSWFRVESIEHVDQLGFAKKLSGKDGIAFDPMIPLDNEEWFSDFKKSQRNFRFGFREIKEKRFIDGFGELAKQFSASAKFPSTEQMQREDRSR